MTELEFIEELNLLGFVNKAVSNSLIDLKNISLPIYEKNAYVHMTDVSNDICIFILSWDDISSINYRDNRKSHFYLDTQSILKLILKHEDFPKESKRNYNLNKLIGI